MKKKIVSKLYLKLSLCLALLTPMNMVVNATNFEDFRKLVVITLKGSPVSSKIQNLKPSERISAMVTEFRLRAGSLLNDLNKEISNGGASEVEPLY